MLRGISASGRERVLSLRRGCTLNREATAIAAPTEPAAHLLLGLLQLLEGRRTLGHARLVLCQDLVERPDLMILLMMVMGTVLIHRTKRLAGQELLLSQRAG